MSVDPATLAYDGDGLVACICQDAATGDVLMLAWANREAVERTLATGRALFWSRSRGELWEKGATSGNTLERRRAERRLRRRRAALPRRSRTAPPATPGSETCWGERASFPAALARTIEARRDADPEHLLRRAPAQRPARARRPQGRRGGDRGAARRARLGRAGRRGRRPASSTRSCCWRATAAIRSTSSPSSRAATRRADGARPSPV